MERDLTARSAAEHDVDAEEYEVELDPRELADAIGERCLVDS
jgi:hypothetical protein